MLIKNQVIILFFDLYGVCEKLILGVLAPPGPCNITPEKTSTCIVHQMAKCRLLTFLERNVSVVGFSAFVIPNIFR